MPSFSGKRGPNPRHHHPPRFGKDPPLSLPALAPSHSYFPLPSTPVTPQQQQSKTNAINSRSTVTSIVHHPINSVLQYPETTESRKDLLAHIFTVDPSAFRDPRLNVQYSLDVQGSKEDQTCRLLGCGDDGKGVLCYKYSTRCKSIWSLLARKSCSPLFPVGKGVKVCWAAPKVLDEHTFVAGEDMLEQDLVGNDSWSASREIFEKTLALYCSLLVEGCPGSSHRAPSASHSSGSGSSTLSAERLALGTREGGTSQSGTVTVPPPSTSSSFALPPRSGPNLQDTSENTVSPHAEPALVDCQSSTPEPDIRFRPKRDYRSERCSGPFLVRKDHTSGVLSLR